MILDNISNIVTLDDFCINRYIIIEKHLSIFIIL